MPSCKGCGRAIEFVESETSGKKIPLEQVNCYAVIPVIGAANRLEKCVARIESSRVWISHYLTCKDANRFTGGKRAEKSEAGGAEQQEKLSPPGV